MSGRNRQSIVANPVLVGAVTTLVVVVAIFLSYNANAGLPFVPTTQLKFQVSNGANLLPGNEVREGGFRVGIVQEMKPLKLEDGKVGAEVVLKLDKKAGAMPTDTTVNIRPRSVLGLKYVELTRGTSGKTFREGDTIPAAQTRFPVELDQLYNIFDEKTRDASQRNLRGFGNTFANRGESLNRTIADAPTFFEHLQPVMTVLSAPTTRLDRFFKELGDAARVVAPVANRYAHSFSVGADTFEAWSRHEQGLADTIDKSAPTLDAGIDSLRTQRPFLVSFRDFSIAMNRAVQELPRTLPRITPALRIGIPVLRRTPEINNDLRRAFEAGTELFRAPGTGIALRGLTALVTTLNPTLRFAGPYITVCNYWNYAWTHAGEHLTEPDATGFAQRSLLNQGPRQDNSPIALGATEPANAEGYIPGQSSAPANAHFNVYTAAVDRQGNADCESGQRGYVERANFFGDPKYRTVIDPHIPGNQGPTFSGRPRVLRGQTFSRAPEVGPQFPAGLDP